MGGRCFVHRLAPFYLCLFKEKEARKRIYIYIYIRGRIYHIAYNGVERLSMEMIVKTDDRSSIAR